MSKYSDIFKEVWETYPNKNGKHEASKKFDKLGFDEVYELKKWISVQDFPEEKKFIPRLITVINQKRWLDEEDTKEKINNMRGVEAWTRLKGYIKTYGCQGHGPPLDEDLRKVVREFGGLQQIGLWKTSEINHKKVNFINKFIDMTI